MFLMAARVKMMASTHIWSTAWLYTCFTTPKSHQHTFTQQPEYRLLLNAHINMCAHGRQILNMSKQDQQGRKIAEASNVRSGGEMWFLLYPHPGQPHKHHNKFNSGLLPCTLSTLQSIYTLAFVRARLVLSFPHLYSSHVCVFQRKEMQMCRFPTSLGNATGRLDREIKQSCRDACGKVAIKYSLTTIQTLSGATSGQVKKLNRDFMQ